MSELDVDSVFYILDDSRRRAAVRAMQGVDSLSFGDLVDRVQQPEEDRKTVYISMKQTHIEVLDEADVLDYRPVSDVVAPGDYFDTVSDVLIDVKTLTDGEKTTGRR